MGQDKIMLEINGSPVICHTLRGFSSAKSVDEIVVVTRADLVAPMRELVQRNGFEKVTHVVPGGETRTASVISGFSALSSDIDFVSIHDGVRPCLSCDEIDAIHRQAQYYGAVCCGVPMTDTVQEVDDRGCISRTLNRDVLYAAATPQVFSRYVYEQALKHAEGQFFTDDAGMVVHAGFSVKMIPCPRHNIKLTTPEDIALATWYLKQ